ncbi:OLC1v1026299C1 [Oldenlandia corymbosa var. corymbosa]|uniref:OLC1v1026299C1 n=1 Tax=Oldenlandia corymbosa var. corymbosa TaxID=529605 RepID=A0AAV1C826_OLDCO|nr:OLC1v1026299C1 [Oldenlandia corymbosa var. corymbosa]
MNKVIEISDRPNCDIIALSFPHPPTSINWSVFGIFHSDKNEDKLIVGSIESGGRQQHWKFGVFPNEYNFRVSNAMLVYHKYQYHCLDVKGRLGKFEDPHGGDVTWNIVPRIGFKGLKLRAVNQTFLAAGEDGDIFAVVVSCDNTEVSVYKLDPFEFEWIPVENLRDRMLFLSETASFGAKATRSAMGNKIYFPKFYGTSGVFYSLSTKKYRSYDGRFAANEPYMLENMSTATWIQPYYPS